MMDLLCKTYSNTSDEDKVIDEEAEDEPKSKRLTLASSKEPKYPKFWAKEVPLHCPNPNPELRNEGPVPGRYISKRERALMGLSSDFASRVSDTGPDSSTNSSTVFGSLSDLDIHQDISSLLRHRAKGPKKLSKICERLSVALESHKKAVNAIQWSPTHVHLLASAGMDQKICIWNVWSKDQKIARVLNSHTAAVKDVKWSPQGLSILSGGYDCISRLIDVEKGVETHSFKEDQAIGVLKFHPNNPNLFLSGGLKGGLKLWDVRNGKVVHEYIRRLGPILDVEFNTNGKQFISSSDVSGSNISENSIIVWDVSRQVPLSNQVYVEAYTCPCVRYHPVDPTFVAQSNGNYIAIFFSTPPFKLDKYKRYEGHGVFGFPVKCNFSLDGEKLISGSSDGSIYFYNYRSSQLVRKIKAYEQACIDVSVHPILPNVIASSSWNGEVSVFE